MRAATAALLLACTLSSSAPGWQQNTDGPNGNLAIRWNSQPIHFLINPSTAFSNISTGTLSAAAAARLAFGTWAAVPTAGVSFQDDGDTTLVSPPQSQPFNLVSFVDNSFLYSGALAVTPYNYDSNTGAMAYATVLLNPTVPFTTRGDPGAYDVQAIVTHEVGHLLGLAHSGLMDATMFPFAAKADSDHRVLSSDDIAGISTLYPPAGQPSSFGAIAGKVTLSSLSAAVFGGHVLAIDALGRAAASSFSGLDGSYRIDGLPPGSYTVLVEPLDGPMLPRNVSSPFFALNLDRITTDFGTAFHAAGAPVTVSSGLVSTGVDLTPGPQPALNLIELAVLPAGVSSFQTTKVSTAAAAGTPSLDLVVGGDGLTPDAQVSVTGGDVTLALLSSSTLPDGKPMLRFRLSVPARASLGPRTILAALPGQLSALAGSLVVTPQPVTDPGPLLACSYGKDPSAVGPGLLHLTVTSDKILQSAPSLSISRPGGGNDVASSQLSAGADALTWVYDYNVLPANGSSILDGACTISIQGATDAAGVPSRGTLDPVFVVDTTPPGGFLTYSRPPAHVKAGSLRITAQFSEPLVSPPTLTIQRPGTANSVPTTSMAGLAGSTVFTFVYELRRADGTTILDGQTLALVGNVFDRAGNAGLPVVNFAFNADTTPASVTLHARTSHPAAGVGVVPLVLTASKPLVANPLITFERPGSGNDTLNEPMPGTTPTTVFVYNQIVLPQDGSTILDGNALISVSNLLDAAGNVTTPPAPVLLPIDTVPPKAVFTFGTPPQQVPAGPLAITAVFSEPLASTPAVWATRPGGGNDLPPTAMAPTADPGTWTASYNVLKQDGVTVLDGLGTVGLANAYDAAGNEAEVSAGAFLVFDTGPLPLVATIDFGRTDPGRVGAGPLGVTATFNYAPPNSGVKLQRLLPDQTAAEAAVALTATTNARVFDAVLTIPVADGVQQFDGLQAVAVVQPDGSPVTTLNGRFRTFTLDSSATGHVELVLGGGYNLVSLPLAPASTAAGGFKASDLARLSGATLVVRSTASAASTTARFQVYVPGGTDFALEGNRSYIVLVPAAVSVKLAGSAWPVAAKSEFLGDGPNLVALPLGSPPGYSSRDLARDTGSSAVLRARAAGRRLVFEASLDAATPGFTLGLENGLLLLHPDGAVVEFKSAP